MIIACLNVGRLSRVVGAFSVLHTVARHYVWLAANVHRPHSSHRKCSNCVAHMMSGMSKDVWVCFMHAHYIERASCNANLRPNQHHCVTCTNCLLKHATHTAWFQPCDQSITHKCMGHPSIRSLRWHTHGELLLSSATLFGPGTTVGHPHGLRCWLRCLVGDAA